MSVLFRRSLAAAPGQEGLSILVDRTVGSGAGTPGSAEPGPGRLVGETTFRRDVVVATAAYVVGRALVLCPIGGAAGSYLAGD